MRTYELMVVLDPRMSDEEATTLTGEIRTLVENSGAEVIKTDIWGRRKLAYEIHKLKEGRYILYYLGTEDGDHSLPEVERRLQQNDQVLRYLTVRTDEDLRRAGLPLPTTDEPVETAEDSDSGDSEDSDSEDAQTKDADTGGDEEE